MKLALFFTRGISLKIWDEKGMFDREVSLYKRFLEMGVTVCFVTYGDSSDLEYQDRLVGITILCNRWKLPSIIYEKLLHLLHGKVLRSCDIIKTNQMNGADVAQRSALYWNKPLICRMGYMWSEFMRNENVSSSQAEIVEDEIFKSTDRIVVTTDAMMKSIVDRIPASSDKTFVIPNYVETDRFAPYTGQPKDFDIIFVGRLCPQKNVTSLLKALSDLDFTSVIVGDGSLRKSLKKQYGNLNGKVKWERSIRNCELPSFMNRSRLFVLPSHYEGHPKTLIEAMSCSLPVLGADSPGIREIIDNGVNGYFCGTDSESIKSAIEELLGNPGLCKTLGENARNYAVNNFSLEDILKMEYELYMEILNEGLTRDSN